MARLLGNTGSCEPGDCEPSGLIESQADPPTDPTPSPTTTSANKICTTSNQKGQPVDCEDPTGDDPSPAEDAGFVSGLNTTSDVKTASPLSPCECSPDQTPIWIVSNTGTLAAGPVFKYGDNCYTQETKSYFEVENVPIADPDDIVGGYDNCSVCCNQYILATQCSCDDSDAVPNGVYVKK